MKIHCPMNPEYAPHTADLVSLGASEFYLGYINQLDGAQSLLSLRLSGHSNFPSLAAAESAIALIKQLGAKAFITLNGPFYPEAFYKTLIRDARRLAASGADGFIVSDIPLMLKIIDAVPAAYIMVSSGAHVINTKVGEFYRSIGARRLILPRQLDPAEIIHMARALPDMDFEIFMKNEECAFMDGYCSYSHHGDMDEKPACNALYTGGAELRAGRTEMWSCGACALHTLRELPALSLKICGRSLRYDPIHKDVDFLRRSLELLERNIPRAEYSAACRALHSKIYGKSCASKCYYNPAAQPAL